MKHVKEISLMMPLTALLKGSWKFRVVLLFITILNSKAYAQYQYPFQNPEKLS